MLNVYRKNCRNLSFLVKRNLTSSFIKTQQYSVENREKTLENINFNDSKVAYKNKTTKQLLRSYMIFKLCSFNSIIEKQGQILRILRKILGQRIFKQIIEATIFKQFLLIKNDEVLRTETLNNFKYGIRPFFAYTCAEYHGDCVLNEHINFNSLWANNFNNFLHCIKTAERNKTTPDAIARASGKYSMLCSIELLVQLNKVIVENEEYLRKYNLSDEEFNSIINKDNLPRDLAKTLPSQSVHNVLFHLKLVQEINPQLALSKEKLEDFNKLWTMLYDLAREAKERNVCFVLDAEQTYVQTAIDYITLDLMRKFNQEKGIVHNTYQCYLKETANKVRKHIRLSELDEFILGFKVVRGAYMEEERRLAVENKYEDPVNENFNKTTDMYYEVANEVLNYACLNEECTVEFGTHNCEGALYVAKKMKEKGLSLQSDRIVIAQLLGMKDHLTYCLGDAGIPVAKLYHYGEVEDSLQYMSRRLNENKAVLQGAAEEGNLLKTEIKRRLLKRN
ncbi:DgyrCDS3030 [Dimorphilus gyrociliatus]|uniref:Proline dehydrogenase n=2 Tax=Dimorphilus gyrociliatus TaxID=2664684 RepID=A0A7I8VBZ3_9ANNE|nr:DgyrCDS3030 [Dimorphilus gyrociliatus]